MRTRWLTSGALLLAIACASKKPPPPVIETQEVELGQDAEQKKADSEPIKEGKSETIGKPVEPGAGGETGSALSAGDAPEIKLLDAGKEPRKVAKHKFRKGAVQKFLMKSKTNVTGASLPIPAILMSVPMDFSILSVDSDGTAKFHMKAGPFKTNQGGGGGALGALGSLMGGGGMGGPPERVSGHGHISPQGVITDFEVEEGGRDDVAPVEVGDAFPTEPIGKGARWVVKVMLQEKNTTVRQTSTYELLSFTGNKLKTKVERVQEPVGGDPDGPGAGSSTGTLEFRLGDVQATGTMKMDKALSVGLPGLGDSVLKMASEAEVKRR